MKKYYYDKTQNLKEALFYVLSGLFMLILRSNSIKVLLVLIGALFIANGVITIVKYNNQISGIISIALGGVILVGGWLFAEIVLIIIGVAFIAKGALSLNEAMRYKKSVMFITSVASMVAGIMLILCRFFLVDIIFIILGILLIINGVLVLIEKK